MVVDVSQPHLNGQANDRFLYLYKMQERFASKRNVWLVDLAQLAPLALPRKMGGKCSSNDTA